MKNFKKDRKLLVDNFQKKKKHDHICVNEKGV